MGNRVVITGLGVVSPNGVGVPAFRSAIKAGQSGIRFIPRLKELNYQSQIGGVPPATYSDKEKFMSPLELKKIEASGVLYGILAGMEAWRDAGLEISPDEKPDWESGTIFGTGTIPTQVMAKALKHIAKNQIRKLGGFTAFQNMPSSVSVFLGKKIGLGNQVSTNSSACTTGTESILMSYRRIRQGLATRMLAGSTSDADYFLWASFEPLRLTTTHYNDDPERASRPMASNASGFVPSAGAGALVLESLESAKKRGAPIYAEVLGGNINSGGHRGGGSMTLFNPEGVRRCIENAIKDAGISPEAIDAINGHLTSAGKDSVEIEGWSKALGRKGTNFPYVTALKSMIGHAIGGAGGIESVAAVLQLKEDFLVPNLNCESLHPKIAELVDRKKIPQRYREKEINVMAKSGFGFGDVNACVIFKKYKP